MFSTIHRENYIYLTNETRFLVGKGLEAIAVSGQIWPLRPIVNAKKQLLCTILLRDGIAAFLSSLQSAPTILLKKEQGEGVLNLPLSPR